jgi:hypothetical protein
MTRLPILVLATHINEGNEPCTALQERHSHREGGRSS